MRTVRDRSSNSGKEAFARLGGELRPGARALAAAPGGSGGGLRAPAPDALALTGARGGAGRGGMGPGGGSAGGVSRGCCPRSGAARRGAAQRPRAGLDTRRFRRGVAGPVRSRGPPEYHDGEPTNRRPLLSATVTKPGAHRESSRGSRMVTIPNAAASGQPTRFYLCISKRDIFGHAALGFEGLRALSPTRGCGSESSRALP